jgi:hypothetical protein
LPDGWSPTDPGACQRSIARPGAPSAEDGNARAASPPTAIEAATTFLDALLLRAPPGTWLARDGERCRILERTPAGVHIDGGDGGFTPRQVTATDLAWVMLAAQAVTDDGGLLDEAGVNRLRYLDGTPKGSTRWIDTGWAIALFAGVVESA